MHSHRGDLLQACLPLPHMSLTWSMTWRGGLIESCLSSHTCHQPHQWHAERDIFVSLALLTCHRPGWWHGEETQLRAVPPPSHMESTFGVSLSPPNTCHWPGWWHGDRDIFVSLALLTCHWPGWWHGEETQLRAVPPPFTHVISIDFPLQGLGFG